MRQAAFAARVGRRLACTAAALPLLQGCAAPLPAIPDDVSPVAQALLAESAAAHGATAFASLADISVRYAGTWPGLIGALQPALVDEAFRGGSEERFLPREGVVAQAHTGPAGRKQVVRRAAAEGPGDVAVWRNGQPDRDAESRAAAALVADGYALFLLGPLLLTGHRATRIVTAAVAGSRRIDVFGTRHDCDVLRMRLRPGLGFAATDEAALYIDRSERLMRRIRFGLDGLDSTRGAVAEVDAADYVAAYGMRWPTRYHERLLRPFPLPVHDWALTGLDVDRGLTVAELVGPEFGGRAAAPAAGLRS